MGRNGSPSLCSRMGNFRKLRVWRHAHALMISVNRVAKTIRGSQYAALRSQIMRAAMSIPANIVEGRAQSSEREFVRFLRYAIASARELEYHLIAAHDIEAISAADFELLCAELIEVRRMLYGLVKKLEPAKPPRLPKRIPAK